MDGGAGADVTRDRGARADGTAAAGDRDPSTALAPGALSTLLRQLADVPPARLDAAWTRAPRPGDTLDGRYEILSELGRGGFGVVFAALDTRIGRTVAVKVLRPGPRLRELLASEPLQTEVEAGARLNDPSIVTLHDTGLWAGGLYLVFECLRGETLAQRSSRGRLPVEEVVRIARHVAGALAAAHAAGVVHRDLKPDNVFLTDDGRVKVLDFGLSRVTGGGPGLAGGTRGYTSPEQARGGSEDARTDVFAFGVVVHEALTGALPYRVLSGRSAVLDPAAAPPARIRGAPAPLARLVRRCLALEPADRPADGRALLAELDLAARRAEAPGRWVRRALVASLALALAVASAAIFWPRSPGTPPVVIVADAMNETDEQALDGVSQLVMAGLARWRIHVVRRERVLDLAEQAGHRGVSRIDASTASSVAALAGADLVLVPRLQRLGHTYGLVVTAVDPRTERDVWATPVVTRDTISDVFALADEVTHAVRTGLRVVPDAPVQSIEALVTRDAVAFAHYADGVHCLEGALARAEERCAPHFQLALARDPAFGLAHYELARLAWLEHRPEASQRSTLAPALRHLERLPERERQLVLAWRDRLAGDVAQARARYVNLGREHPDDEEVAWMAGELEWHDGELAASVPWLERLLGLQPRHEWALDHLVRALGFLGDREKLDALVQRLRTPATVGEYHAIARANGWLGRHEAALAAARRELELDERVGHTDVVAALVSGGRLEEAEALLRREVAASGGRWDARTRLAAVLVQQGRIREARLELERAAVSPGESPTALRYRRLSLLAGLSDVDGVRREVSAMEREAPEEVPWLSLPLAIAGDPAGAARLAKRLPRDSLAVDLHAAVASLRAGDPGDAVRRLRSAPLGRIASDAPVDGPAFLLAESLAAAGAPDALDALRRYQAFYAPASFWRPWALPRSHLLTARVLARTGRLDEARRELALLLASLSRADETFALRAEARALDEELRATGIP